MGMFTKYLDQKDTTPADAQAAPSNDAPAQTGMFKNYLASKGNPDQSPELSVIPNNPYFAPGSQSESVALATSKGLSIGGLGRDLAPIVAAIPSTATDEALGRTYSDRLLQAQSQMAATDQKAEATYPKTSLGSQILSSIPKTASYAASLAAIGLTNLIGQAATIGGIEGLTQSKKRSLAEGVIDTGVGAAASAALAGVGSKLSTALKEGAKEAGVSLNDAYSEFGDLIASTKKPGVEQLGDQVLKVNFNPATKKSVEVGRDMQVALSSDVGQAEVDRLANKTAADLGPVIDQQMSDLGNKRAPILQQYGQSARLSPKETDSFLNGMVDEINKTRTAEGTDADALKNEMLKQVRGFGSRIANGDPLTSGKTGGGFTLQDLSEIQQDFGKDLKLYKSDRSISGLASRIFGKIADQGTELDIAQGSGGELSRINKAFRGLYEMQSNALTGANILGTTPGKTARSAALEDFLASWAKVPADVRAEHGQLVDQYLHGPFQDALDVAQLKNLVKKTMGFGPRNLAAWVTKPGLVRMGNEIGSRLPAPSAPIPGAIPSIGGQGQQLLTGAQGSLGGAISSQLQNGQQ